MVGCVDDMHPAEQAAQSYRRPNGQGHAYRRFEESSPRSKAMNKVYCWLPKAPNVGHASLAISVGEGPGRADYVSWWPTGPAGTKGNQGAKPTKPGEKFNAAVSTYADDTASE